MIDIRIPLARPERVSQVPEVANIFGWHTVVETVHISSTGLTGEYVFHFTKKIEDYKYDEPFLRGLTFGVLCSN